MRVIKRDGTLEPISFDKVLIRIKELCYDLPNVAYDQIAKKVIDGIYDLVYTRELDELAANISYPLSYVHPEYDTLAARLVVSNFHKNGVHYLYNHFLHSMKTGKTRLSALEQDELNNYGVEAIQRRLFYYTCKALYENVDENRVQAPLISPEVFAIVSAYPDELEGMLNYSQDYQYKYLGFEVLRGSYLLKCWLYDADGKRFWTPLERPQHMLMRVALGIHAMGKYVNYHSIRTNHRAIWLWIKDSLTKIFSLRVIEKLEARVNTGTIDWKELDTLLVNNRPSASANTLAAAQGRYIDSVRWLTAESYSQNTRTWEELLYDMIAVNTVSERDEIIRGWIIEARDTYLAMSQGKFTHATPTLYNSGTLKPQNSSCYLMAMPYDSLEGINKYWENGSKISKYAGGIGSHINCIRPRNAYIRGTNGRSNGMVPLLKVTNEISMYIDQGGNKRPGSHAVYVEPWIGDIRAVLDLKKPIGNDRHRARNLFYALWLPDEFMRSVQFENDVTGPLWYLMDPNVCPGLSDAFDRVLCTTHYLSDDELETKKKDFAFTALYREYIREGKYLERVSAKEIWGHIIQMLEETGIPYILMKDACNRKSNQQNLGTIKSSNLCCEIVQFSSPDEISVCNLASICLNRFVSECSTVGGEGDIHEWGFETSLTRLVTGAGPSLPKCFDFVEFEKTIRMIVRNLNKVIKVNFYPVPEAEESNFRHMPIGIGVQGLADLYTSLRLPFNSPEADRLNFYIFEMLYYVALDESCRLAAEEGPYTTFATSPLAEGIFQFDLWKTEQEHEGRNPLKYPLSLDWEYLRERITKVGVRNSLLIAPMPTGTTSSIMGNSPCFEPHNALLYKRSNKSGEFVIANQQLITDLIELELWDEDIRTRIQADDQGGISRITRIPSLVRDIYRTVWDINMKDQIDHALTREVFIDQSESFSWFIPKPTPKILTQLHAYSWRRGRKTSSYYTRRLAPVDAQKIQLAKPAPDAGSPIRVKASLSQRLVEARIRAEKGDCGNGGFCGA
jgi:ribonucleoside-diphosphate reductase alpha subunit